MKKFSYIFLFLIFQFPIFHLFATHNRAGEITYRHVSGTTYEITVTTYTKAESCPADRCEIVIDFGDGSDTLSIQRVNGVSCQNFNNPFCQESSCPKCGELIDSNPTYGGIKKNIYTVQHNFPGPGIYKISVDDPNRNADVMNVPNSENTSFYIESYLYIDGFGGINNSPILDFPPVDMACVNKVFEHNPGAHDPDGDVLKFSLASSMGTSGSPIPGYTMPNNVSGCIGGSLNINSSTGLLTWNTPICCGEFNVAILIEEFRNGNKIGSVLRDMQITVECSCQNLPPFIIAPTQICVFAGDTIDTLITAIDPPSTPTDISGDDVTLTASGEPLILTNSPATFPQPVTGNDTVSAIFYWKTNCAHIKSTPYTVTFRAEDDNPIIQLVDYHTLDITIIAPPVDIDTAIPEGNTVTLSWQPSFCPASGYSIYRRIDSSGFAVPSCQTGLPSGTGYSLIQDCSNQTNTSFLDNNNGQGLVHGQKYCYVVVACLPGNNENVVSEEFCVELKNDVPIITNVSVFKTDANNGADSVIWAMPKELDTLKYPPPYRYKIHRCTYFGNPSQWVGNTQFSNVLALTDTFFIDTTGINTLTDLYTYKIELCSGSNSAGFSQNASSVFLKSVPTDNALKLNWVESVPWLNTKYFVFRKNLFSGDFEYIATTSASDYIDTGLVNGQEYCYYVQSFGTYSSPGVIDTILNNSQIHCNKPYDDVAPCNPDSFSIQADCNLSQNTLVWNNPNSSCADDVVGYRIYYTPRFGGNLSLIETINLSSDTTFLNNNLTSIAGCYAVSAIDTNLNESALSDTACVDNCPLYELPNVFTPGNDGMNDFFHPFPYKYIAGINIQIFNRWGQKVFESIDPDIMWDGKLQKSKKMCPAGVYYYICQVHTIRLTGTETFVLKGYVHLLNESGGAVPTSN